LTVVRYGNDIILIDCGLAFPEEEMLGIDVVIPDITYLLDHRDLVRAILLTHGHEDHIGALPYVLRQINVPVYGTKLTLGLLGGKLRETDFEDKAMLCPIKPRDIVEIGPFRIEFIRVSHSVPDAVGMAIQTPLGLIVHTGDFKIDHTPVDGDVIDLQRFAHHGEKGVLALLSDSTNVERPGYTMSESTIGATFDEAFKEARERILVATFASNVHRLQQAVLAAHRHGRKVAVVGRSMVNVVSIAFQLGYLKIPPGTLVELDEANRLPRNQVVILSTGSQGEPMSALTRMALGEHRQVSIEPNDTIIISATPIPGNEKLVSRVVNHLFKRGAHVIYEKTSGIHVSGHASEEELKLMLNLVRPRFLIPVHGECRMLMKHAKLAEELGMPPENIFVAENGNVIEFTRQTGKISGRVTSGRVLVDGLGIGDVGNIVLRDRKQLAQEGILIVVMTIDPDECTIVAGPDIVSRGFVYVRESEELMDEARTRVAATLDRCSTRKISEWSTIKSEVRDTLSKFLYERTGRRPMILPIIMET
ncbi:MAG: ribonuclease J, partial [Candidatus Desulforudaceae bacterium]